MWWAVAQAWLKKLAWPIAALLGILAFFLSKKSRDDRRVESARAEMKEAVLKYAAEKKKRREAEADAELADKRAGSRSERLAGALRRAGKRLRADSD